MSQAVVGKYMGISGSQLSNWERLGPDSPSKLRYYSHVLEMVEKGELELERSIRVQSEQAGVNRHGVPKEVAQAVMLLRVSMDIEPEEAAAEIGASPEVFSRMELGKVYMTFEALTALLNFYAGKAEENSPVPPAKYEGAQRLLC